MDAISEVLRCCFMDVCCTSGNDSKQVQACLWNNKTISCVSFIHSCPLINKLLGVMCVCIWGQGVHPVIEHQVTLLVLTGVTAACLSTDERSKTRLHHDSFIGADSSVTPWWLCCLIKNILLFDFWPQNCWRKGFLSACNGHSLCCLDTQGHSVWEMPVFKVVSFNYWTDLLVFSFPLAQTFLRPLWSSGFVKWTLSLQEHMFPSATVILLSLAGAQI